MRILARVRPDGTFLEDYIVRNGDEIPEDCIESRPPEGFHLPKWTGAEWVEGLPSEELTAMSLTAAKERRKAEMVEAAGLSEMNDPTSQKGIQTMKAMLSRCAGLTLSAQDITLAKAQRDAIVRLQAKHSEIDAAPSVGAVEAVAW